MTNETTRDTEASTDELSDIDAIEAPEDATGAGAELAEAAHARLDPNRRFAGVSDRRESVLRPRSR